MKKNVFVFVLLVTLFQQTFPNLLLHDTLELTDVEKQQCAMKLNVKDAKPDLTLAYLQKLTQLQARQLGLSYLSIGINAAILLGIYFTLSEVRWLGRKYSKGCI